MKKRGYRNCRSKRTTDYYTKNCNVKHWMLNVLFSGNKDELINYIASQSSVTVYNGEVGNIDCRCQIKFDIHGWDNEISPKRFKHSKAYFRKSRE